MAPVETSYTVGDTSVIVYAPKKLQDDVAKNIQAWELSGLRQICVECRFVTTARDIASEVGIPWHCLESYPTNGLNQSSIVEGSQFGVSAMSAVYDYVPVAIATLSDAQTGTYVRAYLRAAQKSRKALTIQAPKITLFNGQQARIADYSQTPFVVGVQRLATGEVQPKIVVIDQGMKLTFRPVQSADHRKVRLNGRIEFSGIQNVRTESAMLMGEERTIQVPSVRRHQIDLNCEIEDGHSLLIGCGTMTTSNSKEKKLFNALVTVRSVQAD
jgi:Flp pilus assembly secretin CpaC